MKAIGEQIRPTLGDEDNPFEGDVPIDLIEKKIVEIINSNKQKGQRKKFLFDGFLHQGTPETKEGAGDEV